MDKKHLEPHNLERYSFCWSQVRLIVAAVSLLIGGIPVVWYLVPSITFFWIVRPLLTLSWIISGVASAYLLYQWNAKGKMLFGGKKPADLWAFLVSVVSGINLGLAGLLGRNIGISLAPFRPIFTLVGVVYLVTAGYLYSRWTKSGRKLF